MAGVVEADGSPATGPGADPGDGADPTAPPPPGVIDWSGRRAAGGAAPGDPAADPEPTHPAGTRRLAALCGLVAAAYVLWVVTDLVVLAVSPAAYNAVHEAMGSLGARLVLSGVWLAVLFHGADGLRVVAEDFAPGLRRRDRAWRGAVAFLVLATWIPTSLVLVWPAIRWWFA